jgi:hypothetical protein
MQWTMKKYDSEIAVRDDISCVLNGQVQKNNPNRPFEPFFFFSSNEAFRQD